MPSSQDSRPGRPAFDWRWAVLQMALMLLLIWGWQETVNNAAVKPILYSDFKQHVLNGEVVECGLGETQITGRIEPKNTPQTTQTTPPAQPPQSAQSAQQPFRFRTTRVEDPDLVAQLQKFGVKYYGTRPNPLAQFITAWVIPLAIMAFFWIMISRVAGRAGGALMSIGKSRAQLMVDKDTGVSFNDVAGCDEAKYELQEVVDFLRHPQRYQALGAKIPKGVLLVGPPGTGKTLLARAVAGEAKAPFYSLSGSDFVEMFVGVGAARVRDLFQKAKAQAPCIIFIDELDAIGRQRGVHAGISGHDEREQTLNALLVEMDGFDPNVGVIILAATNRPEVLDRALLRPGRFDRQVIVDAPDLDGREAILKVHARGKKLAAEINLRDIASSTPGFSGADLANLLNEAALLAARRGVGAIEQVDLREAIEKVVAGPERKSRRLNEEDKRRVAYHEVGHALVAAYCSSSDPVRKISIIPRGRAALGYTMQSPAEQQFLMTRSEILDRIRGLLGGRAAEAIIFPEVTTGAENDLDRATALARQMVCVFGMSETVGLVRCASPSPSPFLGVEGAMQRDASERTAELIDTEVRGILDNAYADAKRILAEHRDQLEEVTAELLKREALDGEAFYALIGRSVPAVTEHATHTQTPPPFPSEG